MHAMNACTALLYEHITSSQASQAPWEGTLATVVTDDGGAQVAEIRDVRRRNVNRSSELQLEVLHGHDHAAHAVLQSGEQGLMHEL